MERLLNCALPAHEALAHTHARTHARSQARIYIHMVRAAWKWHKQEASHGNIRFRSAERDNEEQR